MIMTLHLWGRREAEISNEVSNAFEAMTEKYVPSSGAAQTEGGEILRAANHILWRYLNDCCVVGGFDCEEVNPPARYLKAHTGSGVAAILNSLFRDAREEDQETYEEHLGEFMEQICFYLQAHPEVFEEPNITNMFDRRFRRNLDLQWDDEEADDYWSYDESYWDESAGFWEDYSLQA